MYDPLEQERNHSPQQERTKNMEANAFKAMRKRKDLDREQQKS